MSYKVNLDQTETNGVVIACSDFRFRLAVATWIDENLDGSADLLVWPGASKAVITKQKETSEAIQILSTLHSETKIIVLDHIDCGAYGGSKAFENSGEEHSKHAEMLAQANEILQKDFPEFTIETYLLGEDGVVPLG